MKRVQSYMFFGIHWLYWPLKIGEYRFLAAGEADKKINYT